MSLNGTVWAPIGPNPMNEGGVEYNGLVTTIAVNPNNASMLYLGTVQGGVWRSDDGGDHWRPLFDHQPATGIGEPGGIAIDPNNTDTIYVGTSGGGRQPTAGLFKSTDGGASWIVLGSGYPAGNNGTASQFAKQNIFVVLVDPANSNVLYLGSSNGVFTSPDGGRNWKAASGISGGARSLALDLSSPTAARILHAGISGNGVFISKDGGLTFSQTLSATTSAVKTALTGGGFRAGGGGACAADLTTEPQRGAGALRDTLGFRCGARSGWRVHQQRSRGDVDPASSDWHVGDHLRRLRARHDR